MQADEGESKKITQTKNISTKKGMDGIRINVDDEKFDLILNIMVGIKKSISNLIEIAVPLTDQHFVGKLKTENQWIANFDSK